MGEDEIAKAVEDGYELGPGVTPKDMIAVRSLRSFYTNRVFLQISGANIRLNFGEMVSGEAIYHTALIMSATEAVGYADIIREIAQRAVDQLADSGFADGE
ncbi:hypothetical protein [Sphingomonas sp.]|uniref:hypothetical protein n=1 Tax=Sphingomonas sp. TaxID=28214 RepID=UPI0035BC804E